MSTGLASLKAQMDQRMKLFPGGGKKTKNASDSDEDDDDDDDDDSDSD